MDTTAWISLAAISISGLSLFAHRLARRKPRHDASDQHFGGDCFPHPVMRGDFKAFHSGSITHE